VTQARRLAASYYFSLMQYSTAGSSLNLPPHWRLLEGMLPIAGLMTFAWSTGVLGLIHKRRAERKSLKGRSA
jgi:hypothetical protein